MPLIRSNTFSTPTCLFRYCQRIYRVNIAACDKYWAHGIRNTSLHWFLSITARLFYSIVILCEENRSWVRDAQRLLYCSGEFLVIDERWRCTCPESRFWSFLHHFFGLTTAWEFSRDEISIITSVFFIRLMSCVRVFP